MFFKSPQREFTFRAVFLGSILAVILGAANMYLGLYAGMTVSASIPAAVLSMAILRGIFRKGTILENNIVQAIASSGEALAAGVLFTVPALVITGSWHKFEYWPTTLISVAGALLGILFMIPLRRALIVEEKELTYPEGTACAEVLKAGDEGGKGGRLILLSILFSGFYKFLISGVSLLTGSLVLAFNWGRSVFYFGTANSLALTAVGAIVGLNIGLLIAAGGIIGWCIGIPLYSFFHGASGTTALESAEIIWSQQIRYIGVGAMAVGGIWTIFSVRQGIVAGFKKLFGKSEAVTKDPTDTDLRRHALLPLLLMTILLIFGIYESMLGEFHLSLLATGLMVIAAFFFVAIASYITGLVGSSNMPASGMTICTVLFASAIIAVFGFSGTVAVSAVLGIAGIVCVSAASAADISQDLKTGYLVGATPWKMQIGEIVGAVAASLCLAPILTVLHTSYGIGIAVREGVKPLAAPQAMLFSKLTEFFFMGTGQLPMGMVVIGMILAFVVIFADQILKNRKSRFRLYVMAFSIGLYLPLEVTFPMLIGGLIHFMITGKIDAEETTKGSNTGVLVASGLIAGEALMGIGLAFLIFFGFNLPIGLGSFSPSTLLSTAVYGVILVLLARVMKKT